ncbi:hypothetical protein FGRMN_11045 [Fusarium graminum]|nr:hypothetical protein FGRMN_11045 [Fusarium graminum]
MTLDSPTSPKPGHLLVCSTTSPEEVRIFDLRGSDIQDIRPAPESEVPMSPEEWGFTGPVADGLCKHCQLMLHPDAPQLIEHHPNVQRLINSAENCSVCKWLEVSITKGSESLVAQYQQGDPELCDENSTTRPVTVELTKYERHTVATGIIGDIKLYTNRGVPLIITSQTRLGDLATRRFWIPYDELDQTKPYERQDILKTWLSECEIHEVCSTCLPSTRNARLPARVLDLTGSPDLPSEPNDISIKLRETQEAEVGTYVALSYCWGTNPDLHFKTTLDNLQTHKQGIDFSSLPLTHREAILATLYLGIRYLWIDSMCIIQDSREDWEAESAKMGSVYSNSHLTLAATSSETPEKGLLLPFQAALTVKIHGETISVRMATHQTIDRDSEPLNTRGWTLQEAVLASRIVCFGEEQWLWKCPNRYATEDGLVDDPKPDGGGLTLWADLIHQGPGEDGKSYLRHWYRMVENYSKRNLTYQNDKWNAIAGLTEMFVTQTGYHYLAGIWEEDLANGLMWEATSKGVIREAGSIPSWSWLSVKGAVMGLRHRDTVSMIELVKAEQQWQGVPLASPLTVARLTINGRALQVELKRRSTAQDSHQYVAFAPQSDLILGVAFTDTQLPGDTDLSSVLCLFVLEAASKTEYSVLLLAPVSGNSEKSVDKKYKRLGMGVIWKKSRTYTDREDGIQILEKASLDTLVLV